jgi:outer membrane biosynthesis protein TonB
MEPPVRESQKSSPATTEELHLLIDELGDELSGYRWREAVWISIVIHSVLFVVWLTAPRWMPGKIVILPASEAHKQTTFLTLPSDLQHVKPPPTDMISDKNRTAQTRVPVPNLEHPRIPDAQRPGAPARPAPAPAPSQQAMQQQPQPADQQGAANPSQQQPQPPVQTAQMQTPKPPVSSSNPFKVGAPGSAVEQAIHSAAGSHGSNRVSFGGDYGSRHDEKRSDPRGDLEVLSDTMGVDFGPYLQRVKFKVQDNWYRLIPESALFLMKKGKLTIDFAILKDGTVAGLRYTIHSGDDALDRPAYGSITASTPFPPLPHEFKGQYLQLRFRFYYNPDKNDLD